jgi:hypothetical protein
MQRINVKSITIIEGRIISTFASITSLKFDRNLKSTTGAAATESGKDRFGILLGQKVGNLGQEMLYSGKGHGGNLVGLIVISHFHD